MRKAVVTDKGTEIVEYTGAELEEYNNAQPQRDADRIASKLSSIKQYRLDKLQDTDYLANSDMTMPENIKTWRQSLRDIPQNYTTESEYDLLLEVDDATGQLTHAVWSKP
jgi:hypothetical protein